MDPRNLESEALGVPNTRPWPEVGSHLSNIKLQHPKPNQCSGGEESMFGFSAGIHKQRKHMPMVARTTKGKMRTSYRPKLARDGTKTKMVHFVYSISARRAKPLKYVKSSHSCVKLDISYKPGISINTLNGDFIPDLYSDEYEFDTNEYQKWHLDYKFNLDDAASVSKHKCVDYASKDKSFLDFTTKDLHNKSIWLFPPIELAKEFIHHFEAIRLQQPDSMMAVICLPRLITLGSNYKELVKKYILIHSYPASTYIFSRIVENSPFERINIPLAALMIYSWPTNLSPIENFNLFVLKRTQFTNLKYALRH
jgi:hypothetical protein